MLSGEDLPDTLFPSRGDAESWLGEHWRTLRESGAERVVLLNEGVAKYTMSLNDEI